MTRAYHFFVPGQPKPKERARKGRGGKFYTPESTRTWEELVAQYALMTSRGELLHGDLVVELTFYRKGQRRADWDNLAKGAADACNGILWTDDKQITKCTTEIIYGSKTPGVTIKVEEREA